jgi:dihydropyrimidinase
VSDRRLLIQGGRIVTADGTLDGNVMVSGDVIEAVGTTDESADEVFDAAGKLVVPGAVDAHTHFDMEVGATRSADDFYTGTRAAACGGTTCVIDFATAYRGESVAAGLANWHAKAAGKAVVDFGFHMSITELVRPAHDIVAEMSEAGITSFKLYMTYPERLMVDDDVILEMLRAAADTNSLICLHCEDDATVSRLRHEALGSGRTQPKWHAWSRPPEAEADAVLRAARMAEEAGAACYVVHLSSADALTRVREARDRGQPIYAETCPQYLYLSKDRYEDVPERAARYVCAPPLREGRHHEELWEGLKQGHLQVVSTDHCPFDTASKAAGLGGGGWSSFAEIPGGLPGVEMRLALIYQKVVEGELTHSEWIDRCCTAPARIFGLYPRKGALVPGADADVVVFDPDLEKRLVAENLHMNVDYTGFDDLVVKGWPALVLCRGKTVARDGEPVGEAGWGRYVKRGPSGPEAGQQTGAGVGA